MATTKSRLFGALQTLGEEITAQKAAAAAGHQKQAGPTPSDPGGYQGSSDHPTTDADNRGQAATEGARSSENESDVKDDQGAPSVNSAPMASPGDNKDKSLNIGTQASFTGEDPSVEDDYKGNKDDPGTSAPATTEDGEKYGSVSFKEAHARCIELADAVLADLALGLPLNGRPAKQAAAPAAPAAPATKAASTDTDSLAGYELAASLGWTKEAAEANVQASIEQTILDARTDAELFGGYYQQKLAADDEEGQGEGEDNSEPSDKGSGASPAGDASGDAPSGGGGGGAPPAAEPAAAGGGGGAPPAGLEALLGGGGGMGGEPSLAAQPPSADEALQELAMALQELGIPVEALAAAAGGGGAPGADPTGGMGGGAPMGDPTGGMGGGAPPAADPMAAMGPKLAAAVTAFKRSGKFEIKEARTKRSRQLRDEMKGHVLELVGNR